MLICKDCKYVAPKALFLNNYSTKVSTFPSYICPICGSHDVEDISPYWKRTVVINKDELTPEIIAKLHDYTFILEKDYGEKLELDFGKIKMILHRTSSGSYYLKVIKCCMEQ